MSEVQLYHGDCLEVMAQLETGSIDAIIADLPYGTTACKWDTIIPFEPLWKQYKRLIKERGAIVLFGSQPFTSALVMSNPKWFKHDIVWEKDRGNGFILAGSRPNQVHEHIAVFSQADYHPSAKNKATYNPVLTSGRSPTLAERTKFHGMSQRQEEMRGKRKTTQAFISLDKDGAYPRSVVYFTKDSPSTHHTQKPLLLMELLILLYTNEGETVLDNVMGSGTTGAACVNTNRDFIGIEREPEYFEIARRRIEHAKNQTRQLEMAIS